MIKGGFIRNSIIVMVLIIAGKILALIRDALIAANFGATSVTDTYNFALGVVYLLTTVSYGLTTTFIPVHSELVIKKGRENNRYFVNNVLSVTSVAVLILSIVMIIFSKTIIDIFAPGFKSDISVYSNSILILRIMLSSLIFISLQSVITGVLQVHKQFFEPAAMAAAANVVYIFYLIFLTKDYGIKGFAVATVIAFLVQLLINLPKYFRLGYSYKPVFNIRDERLRSIFILMAPVIISTSLIQLTMFINRSFATTIFQGAVTVLDFSNKINTLAYEVFAIGIAMIIYPTLSELAAKGNMEGYRKALVKGLNTILLIMVPAAFAIAILRMPLITIIFERGAFTHQAALATASALLFFCPAMIAYSVRDILNKAFYSIKDTKTPMLNSFVGIILNIALNIILIGRMGVSGLTLATSVSAFAATLLMLKSINRKLGGVDLMDTAKTTVKIVISASVMAVSIYAINSFCINAFGSGLSGSIISIFMNLIAGTAVYFMGIYLLKVDEFKWLIDSLKGKMKKGGTAQ
ncbi:MAG: murein biosynthesis integral membrane protein MurJ [Clostridiaceae bacterium]